MYCILDIETGVAQLELSPDQGSQSKGAVNVDRRLIVVRFCGAAGHGERAQERNETQNMVHVKVGNQYCLDRGQFAGSTELHKTVLSALATIDHDSLISQIDEERGVIALKRGHGRCAKELERYRRRHGWR